jgi:hypothetical protein
MLTDPQDGLVRGLSSLVAHWNGVIEGKSGWSPVRGRRLRVVEAIGIIHRWDLEKQQLFPGPVQKAKEFTVRSDLTKLKSKLAKGRQFAQIPRQKTQYSTGRRWRSWLTEPT